MKLIDINALLAEIEKRKLHHIELTEYNSGYKNALIDVLSFIDTLEVKRVDLEKEIDNYISSNFFGSQTLGFFANRTEEEPNDQDIALCARHFFELGLKVAQKGE